MYHILEKGHKKSVPKKTPQKYDLMKRMPYNTKCLPFTKKRVSINIYVIKYTLKEKRNRSNALLSRSSRRYNTSEVDLWIPYNYLNAKRNNIPVAKRESAAEKDPKLSFHSEWQSLICL
ncbi:hypothetical protein NPIL_200941 [Nephila pilipes]|uniref:Uncharacterized protein n=1 Tax=Nephila pilipes TaxID=299642 RepID=A0A8X6NHB3_NEPPI|nr:hypothetical protein NPIL_200941 [Nephila pilipes]